MDRKKIVKKKNWGKKKQKTQKQPELDSNPGGLCPDPKTQRDPTGRLLIFSAHVSTAEHFPQRRLCGGDAADHGQQACPEEANRCRATSAAGCRLPLLQLPAAGGGCQLVVVSS